MTGGTVFGRICEGQAGKKALQGRSQDTGGPAFFVPGISVKEDSALAADLLCFLCVFGEEEISPGSSPGIFQPGKPGALIDLQAAELDYCEHKDFIHPGYAFTGTVWKTAGCVGRRMQSARGK